MNPYLLPAIAAVLTAVVSAFAAWYVARRQASGRIETSTAADLWSESKAIRQTLKEQNELLVTDLETTRTRTLAMQVELETLKTDLITAHEEARRCTVLIESVRSENEMLRGSNLALARRVNELETKAVSMVPSAMQPPIPGNGEVGGGRST